MTSIDLHSKHRDGVYGYRMRYKVQVYVGSGVEGRTLGRLWLDIGFPVEMILYHHLRA